jgi:8-oxo-dGTP diphosphatase
MERASGLFRRAQIHNHNLPIAHDNTKTMATTNKRRRVHASNNGNTIVILSVLALITILVVLGIFIKVLPAKVSLTSNTFKSSHLHGEEKTWHGGHPAEDRPGSCWCGGDAYCMCTPSVAIDIVLYSKTETNAYSVWAVRRVDTGQMATVGGFVNVGETTESAALREAEEETGIIIPPEQAKSSMKLIGVYSDPRRDNRRSIVSIAYALEFIPFTKDGSNTPKAGDDAKEVISVPLDDIGIKYKGDDWYADHLTLLLDFKEQLKATEDAVVVREGELYEDVARSTCSSIS